MMREQTMSSNDPTSNTEMSPKTEREREREGENNRIKEWDRSACIGR